jgi:hypothetical protein
MTSPVYVAFCRFLQSRGSFSLSSLLKLSSAFPSPQVVLSFPHSSSCPQLSPLLKLSSAFPTPQVVLSFPYSSSCPQLYPLLKLSSAFLSPQVVLSFPLSSSCPQLSPPHAFLKINALCCQLSPSFYCLLYRFHLYVISTL